MYTVSPERSASMIRSALAKLIGSPAVIPWPERILALSLTSAVFSTRPGPQPTAKQMAKTSRSARYSVEKFFSQELSFSIWSRPR